MAESNSAETRKDCLCKLAQTSEQLKHLAGKIDFFVDCMSFMLSKQDVSSLTEKVLKFSKVVSHMDKEFTELNCGLYDLSNDSDVVPCVSQDPNEKIEVETFLEKKNLSMRAVKKTRIYIENPCYLESALHIAASDEVISETSKFLREQWWGYVKTMSKFFPEESDLPDASEGLNCLQTETFEKLRMPLIKILDKLCEKLQTKRLANVEVHDNIFHVFRDINKKFDDLFEKTLWQDEEWLGRWGGVLTGVKKYL